MDDTILQSGGILLSHTIPCSGMLVEPKSAGRSNCLHLGTLNAARVLNIFGNLTDTCTIKVVPLWLIQLKTWDIVHVVDENPESVQTNFIILSTILT